MIYPTIASVQHDSEAKMNCRQHIDRRIVYNQSNFSHKH